MSGRVYFSAYDSDSAGTSLHSRRILERLRALGIHRLQRSWACGAASQSGCESFYLDFIFAGTDRENRRRVHPVESGVARPECSEAFLLLLLAIRHHTDAVRGALAGRVHRGTQKGERALYPPSLYRSPVAFEAGIQRLFDVVGERNRASQGSSQVEPNRYLHIDAGGCATATDPHSEKRHGVTFIGRNYI